MPRRSSSTSSFGSARREGNDSSAFYATRLYAGLRLPERKPYQETEIPKRFRNRILQRSSEKMAELPASSVHLMVTSPPYNVGKDYDDDLSLPQYRRLLRRVWKETHRVLVPGGRACINIANLGRRPYLPLHAFVAEDMISLGFLMRGEIIWNKGASSTTSTAWGSWRSSSNPTLRDVHEYILVFSKGDFRREKLDGKVPTISKKDFLRSTRSVWRLRAEPAARIGHPAPFPVELPYRLIQLYTYADEVVLDPFMGSGQTAIAALKAGRRYVGYELSRRYARLARARIRTWVQQAEGG